jgi:hypothetical protein
MEVEMIERSGDPSLPGKRDKKIFTDGVYLPDAGMSMMN